MDEGDISDADSLDVNNRSSFSHGSDFSDADNTGRPIEAIESDGDSIDVNNRSSFSQGSEYFDADNAENTGRPHGQTIWLLIFFYFDII